MALPLPASLASQETPFKRPFNLAARITSPLAVESDSYLGGFAFGARLRYLDMMQFVWWTPGAMPTAFGYGSGAYGSGPYGEAAPVVATGYGSRAYGSGPYGEAASGAFGAGNYGRGPFGGS